MIRAADAHVPGDPPARVAVAGPSAEGGDLPWERRGWLDEASTWIREQARLAGCGAVTRIVPYRLTRRSALLGADTRTGRLFLKCGLETARHEPGLTAFLSREYPGRFAPVVATDTGRCWLLMREVGGRSLMLTSNAAPWADALERLARLQMDLSHRLGRLGELGCADRTLSWVASRVPDLVRWRFAHADVTAEERRAITAAIPVWQRWSSERASDRVPLATLDHGDLHPANLIVSEYGTTYLDWEAAAIGHPFFSPLILLGYMERLLPAMAAKRDMLRAAYLRPWAETLPAAELIDTFERCRPLACLRYALGAAGLATPALNRTIEEERHACETIRLCLSAALPVAGDGSDGGSLRR